MEEMSDKDKVHKLELLVTALQQRIGEMTSQYEMQNATFRAEITILMDENNELKKSLRGADGSV